MPLLVKCFCKRNVKNLILKLFSHGEDLYISCSGLLCGEFMFWFSVGFLSGNMVAFRRCLEGTF